MNRIITSTEAETESVAEYYRHYSRYHIQIT